MFIRPRGQGGSNGAADLGRHGQSLISSPASRGQGGLAGSPRTPCHQLNLTTVFGQDSLSAISPEASGTPIADALPAAAPHCTRRSRSPSEGSPRSGPCGPAPIGNVPLSHLMITLVDSLLATSLCCVRREHSQWCEERH